MRKDETTFTCDRDGQTAVFNDPLGNDDEMEKELTRRGWRVIDYGTVRISGHRLLPLSPSNMLVCRDCALGVAEFLDKDTYKNWFRDLGNTEDVSLSTES